jgi:NADH-quinone oxidoreductase subunit C/D
MPNDNGDNDKITVPDELNGNIFVRRLTDGVDFIYNWGRVYSTWPMLFGLACCAIEMIAAAAARYDFSRFGMEIMRPSPRQADLMIVAGTVTKKMVPQVVRLYNQMAEPKYVLAMGACATSGGPFKAGYNVVSGVDKFLPVDVYVPGCPPTPQALINGFVKIHEMLRGQSVFQVPWYKEEPREPVPVPILGPDVVNPAQLLRVKEIIKQTREREEVAEEEQPEAKPPKLPTWDITPTERAGELAGQLNAALGAEAVTAEKEALIVPPDHLLAAARYLRDELAYNYLTSATAIDYLGREERFEVAYNLDSIGEEKRETLYLKARVGEDNPVIPSLVSIWPGAHLQELEMYDLFGLRFTGHPNLRRIFLWEGFAGYPMRKDYKEAYYEQDNKPFKSRYPGGHHRLAEEQATFHDNVVYPEDWDPDTWTPEGEWLPIIDLPEAKMGGFGTERIIVNMGPQHPSTHGVLRLLVSLEGETIVDIEPVLGHLHRNHEKIGERNSWLMNMPFTDRLDYITSMANNMAYAVAVERLAGLEVPERAEYIRIIMVELTRVLNHMLLFGFMLNDLGAFFTPMLYALRERELILDLFEMVSGSRLMCNYMRFGGVARDMSEEALALARELVHERLPRKLEDLDNLLTKNEILLARTKGVSVVTPEVAIAHSLSGPMLRSTGVAHDLRRAKPYSIYDRFDFNVCTCPNGDLYDRYLVRFKEIYESLKILRQALEQIPEGEIQAGKKGWSTRVPAGEVYSSIESPKGELGFYLVSDGGSNPYRYHVRSPAYINLGVLGEMSKGHKVADVVVNVGSIDITLGEVDR